MGTHKGHVDRGLVLEDLENPSYLWMYKLYPLVLAVEMCDDFPPSSPKFFRGIKD